MIFQFSYTDIVQHVPETKILFLFEVKYFNRWWKQWKTFIIFYGYILAGNSINEAAKKRFGMSFIVISKEPLTIKGLTCQPPKYALILVGNVLKKFAFLVVIRGHFFCLERKRGETTLHATCLFFLLLAIYIICKVYFWHLFKWVPQRVVEWIIWIAIQAAESQKNV